MCTQKACAATSKDMCQWLESTNSNPSNANWHFIHANSFSYTYIPRNSESSTIPSFYLHESTMDASQYKPFAWEYSLWNAAVTALQFWTADLKPHVLSNAIDWVYAAFFYSNHAQWIQNLPEEILFGHFVTTLSDAFKTELAQKDEVYESGSENFNIPTHLSKALIIYQVSTVEDSSFNPANFGQLPTTPEQHEESSSHRHRCHSNTCHHLVFTSSDDESAVRPSENTAYAPVPILKVQPIGEQTFHPQCTTTCVIASHPPQTGSSQKHWLMIPPPRNTSHQYHWMMVSRLKNQFQTDSCASMRYLTSQITSVPTLFYMTAPPSGWT